VDLEAVRGEKHCDEPFSDVVKVAFDRTDHDASARRLRLMRRVERGTDHLHRRLHRLGTLDELGEEILPLVPELADAADPGDEAVLDGGEEFGGGGDELLGEPACVVDVPVDHGVMHCFQVRMRHEGTVRAGRGEYSDNRHTKVRDRGERRNAMRRQAMRRWGERREAMSRNGGMTDVGS